jgi:hypothetical protein
MGGNVDAREIDAREMPPRKRRDRLREYVSEKMLGLREMLPG